MMYRYDVAMTTDDAALSAHLAWAIEECRKVDDNPTRFRNMISQHGSVETLRRLLEAKEVSDGFGTLIMKGRLDLSAEAIALLPQFQHHFTTEHRARERLKGTPYALPDA